MFPYWDQVTEMYTMTHILISTKHILTSCPFTGRARDVAPTLPGKGILACLC